MSTLKIEANIPIPPPVARNNRNRKYPLNHFQIGDSFFVPGKSGMRSTYLLAAAKRLGIVISTRRLSEAGVDGTRVWRIK